MKNTIKILVILAFWFFDTGIKAQDRNVVWVHGFKSNDLFWQRYDNIFESERKINGLRQSYNTTQGLSYAANNVRNSMVVLPNGGANSPNNIGIGHSMGGLMVREVDRTSSRFGGLITVTATNYGAPIANAIKDGSVYNSYTNACDKIKAGPLSEGFLLPWEIVVGLNSIDLCKHFINKDFVDSMYGSPQTITDLQTGSYAVNTVNNYSTTIPMISIWAEENSPVHWRTVSSILYGNDMQLVNKVNDARGVYNAMMNYNQARAVANSFWNPFLAAKYSYKALQWKKGRDWIDDSETIWCSLIKTTRTEQQTYWAEVWVPCDPYPVLQSLEALNVQPMIVAPDPDCGEWQWQQRTRYVTVNYPSDGLLPQYTQQLQGIPVGNRYKIEGANHIEVGNMSNSSQGDKTRDIFNEIFSRQDRDFFHTAKRGQ